MTVQEFDEVMGVNLRGAFLSVSACLPAMKSRGKGRIVLTSSITGPITGYPGWAHYGASKAGQSGFMRTAANEGEDIVVGRQSARHSKGMNQDRKVTEIGDKAPCNMRGCRSGTDRNRLHLKELRW